MHAWPAPELPPLPGEGLPLRLLDTSSGEVRPTEPGPTARIYVCGITPYDATHIGHAATYVAFDLLVRAWRDAGHDVNYVQNVTDVDDPLLERATRDGVDWHELAEREIELYREDMTALAVLPPRTFIGAIEAIPGIVEAIDGLRERGAVYDVEGDTYFSVHSDPHFGEVSNLDEPTMLRLAAERGGDPDRQGKKHRLDCLLWQAARPGEPSWQTSLGAGRPGWHIECTAIALEHLGNGIDVQGGGSDLAFPHHEMGASEGHVLTGEWPFAHHYVHTGMVALAGEKMSKSRGNLVFVSKLRQAGHDPMAIRLALLAHHYRTDWEWTDADLTSAEARLARWREAVALPAGPPAGPVLEGIRRHQADDLDAPGSLLVVDKWAAEALGAGTVEPPAETAGSDEAAPARGAGSDEAAPALVASAVDALLGIRL